MPNLKTPQNCRPRAILHLIGICLAFLLWSYPALAKTPNYFRILGLSEHATPAQIETRFKALMQDESLQDSYDLYLDAYSFLKNDTNRMNLAAQIKIDEEKEAHFEKILATIKPTVQEQKYLNAVEYESSPYYEDEDLAELNQRLWIGFNANGKLLNERNFITTFFFLEDTAERAEFFERHVYASYFKEGIIKLMLVASKVWDPDKFYFEKFKTEFTQTLLEILDLYYEDPKVALTELSQYMYTYHVLRSGDYRPRFEDNYQFEDYLLNLSETESKWRFVDNYLANNNQLRDLQMNVLTHADEYNRYQLGRFLVDLNAEIGSPQALQAMVTNHENTLRTLTQFAFRGKKLDDFRSDLRKMNLYTEQAVAALSIDHPVLSKSLPTKMKKFGSTICREILGTNKLLETNFPMPRRKR